LEQWYAKRISGFWQSAKLVAGWEARIPYFVVFG